MTPLGAGVCAPLEGGISAEAATAALGAAWSYNYLPRPEGSRPTPMLRARDYSPQAGDGSISGAWWQRVIAHMENPDEVTIVFNEPNFAHQDNLDAAEAARRVAEDFVGRIVVYDSTVRQGQTPRILPVRWCGPNVMANLESSRLWIEAYIAAGGPEPHWNGCHIYAADARDLRHQVEVWRVFLEHSVGWHNPMVLTEVGPRPGGESDAAGVLRAAFELLAEGRIVGFAWFSSRYGAEGGVFSGGDLLRADGTLTALGAAYRALATGEQPTVRPVAWFPVAAR